MDREMQRGTICFYKPLDGFGFIEPDDRSANVYFRTSYGVGYYCDGSDQPVVENLPDITKKGRRVVYHAEMVTKGPRAKVWGL